MKPKHDQLNTQMLRLAEYYSEEWPVEVLDTITANILKDLTR